MKSPRKQRLSPPSPTPPPLPRRLLSSPPADTLSSLWANGSSTQLLILQKKWRRGRREQETREKHFHTRRPHNLCHSIGPTSTEAKIAFKSHLLGVRGLKYSN